MPNRHSPTPTIEWSDPATLLRHSAAGLVVSGDSGSGKSNFMRLLLRSVISSGFGATLIDPHGDLTADVERDCTALSASQRQRIVILRFTGVARLPAFNPLAIDAPPTEALIHRAQIASKVGHVSKILLYSWGERDFNSKPLLFKWVTRCLTMLARAGLTIPDVRHFFDVQSPVYSALARTAGDSISRLELEELADMRPREREELIASTKNRFLGFLENPITELVLGGVHQWLSMRRLIRQRAVILVDLSRGGVLRDEDVEIYANLILNEILYAVFNTPRQERESHFVFLDELPVFQSSFDLITRALGQVRKFLIRFVCAFQGTQLFAERTEDRLLNALIGQCNVHLLFRHKNPADARFFADILQLPSADPWKRKHVLTQMQQYQDGHELVTLTDESSNWSSAEQSGVSDGRESSSSTSTGSTRSESTSDTTTELDRRLSAAVQHARGKQTGFSHSDTSLTGNGESHTVSQSSTRSTGGGLTRKQTLVPRIRERRVVTSVQFLPLDEQNAMLARRVATLPIGTAIVYIGGGGMSLAKLPLASDHLQRTPKFAIKKLRELRGMVLSRPEFATADERTADRIEFERRLVEYLDNIASTQKASPAPAVAPPDPNPLLDI